MTIRNLDSFLAERQLIQNCPLSLLKGCSLAIEGHMWVKKLLTGKGKEFSPVAMGGVPLALETHILTELKNYKDHKIDVTFVFSSLTPIKKDHPFIMKDTRPMKRTQAWEAYESGDSVTSANLWENSISVQPELMNFVFKILVENDQPFIRAPYSSWGQIAYMIKEEQFHAVVANTELLLFDVDKIITSINFEKNEEFSFVQKSRILQEMQMSNIQFLDICVLSGFDLSPTFPPLVPEGIPFKFKSAVDMVRQYKTGYNAVNAFAEHPEVVKLNYVDNFCRTVSAIKYHPYFSNKGVVSFFNKEECPSDVHEFIGHRFPDELYYYLCSGLISHHVLSSLISGVIVDTHPLCNGEYKQYQKLLVDILPIRSQTMALLVRHLHGVFQSRKVKVIYWFDPEKEHHLLSYDSIHMPKLQTQKWRCNQELLHKEMKRQEFEGEDFLNLFILASGNQKFLAQDDVSPSPKMTTVGQVVVTAIARFMELRGLLYVHGNTKTHPFGYGLYKSIYKIAGLPRDQTEGLVLALELIKLGAFNNELYDPTYKETNCAHIPEPDRKHVRLFARTLCLLSMSYSKAPWEGPVDRNLLCFLSSIKLMIRTLRHQLEMISLGLFLNSEVAKPFTGHKEVFTKLPFIHEPSTAVGTLAKQYLAKVCQKPDKDRETWFEPAQLPKFFASGADILDEMRRGFEFWDQVVNAITALNSKLEIPHEITQQFIEADKWLEDKRV